MNKRIKELAGQARNYALDEKRIYERMNNTEQCMEEYREVYNKKFVELLIAAVMAEVRDEIQYEYDWTLADIVTERVKKAFGVTQ